MGYKDASSSSSSDRTFCNGYLVQIVLVLLTALVGLCSIVFFGRYLGQQMKWDGFKNDGILVMYVFSNTHSTYAENLKFFIREAVHADDGCDYVFVVQQGDDIPELEALPNLPPNARYEFHTNKGYDWGTLGWLISKKKVNINKYNYFVFVNCSVRGPYLPSYLKGLIRWVDLFLAKLNDKVKLVGPIINCEGTPLDGDRGGMWRTNPHVESHAFATDRIGLQLMIDDGRVFQSYESYWDTAYYSELGASNAILDAGYNLDSFMMRYQNVNWLDPSVWSCNQRSNPSGQFWYDGISLHPFEVLFVKVQEHLLLNRWDYIRVAYKFDDWIQQNGMQEVESNEWKDGPTPFKVPFILAMERRGGECFDVQYYKDNNKDLDPGWSDQKMFTHFSQAGQFEGRQFRFTCAADFSGVTRTFFHNSTK